MDVAERTVSRLIARPRRPPPQTWRALLTNHGSGLDRLLHRPHGAIACALRPGCPRPPSAPGPYFNITERPTAACTAQPLVDTLPGDTPRLSAPQSRYEPRRRFSPPGP